MLFIVTQKFPGINFYDSTSSEEKEGIQLRGFADKTLSFLPMEISSLKVLLRPSKPTSLE